MTICGAFDNVISTRIEFWRGVISSCLFLNILLLQCSFCRYFMLFVSFCFKYNYCRGIWSLDRLGSRRHLGISCRKIFKRNPHGWQQLSNPYTVKQQHCQPIAISGHAGAFAQSSRGVHPRGAGSLTFTSLAATDSGPQWHQQHRHSLSAECDGNSGYSNTIHLAQPDRKLCSSAGGGVHWMGRTFAADHFILSPRNIAQ